MRILLRGYKHPLQPMQPEDVLDRNVLGYNSGNLVFSEASYRALATSSASITLSDFDGLGDDPDRINEEYDAVVLPFANAFRPDFVKSLNRYTRMIRRLRIPVTVLGIGAQSDLDYSLEPLAGLREPVTNFVAAVLERAPSIGVRGEFTARYLRDLGFSDVTVVGCPSLFLRGAAMPRTRDVGALTTTSRVAINLTPQVHHPGLLEHHLDRYPGLVYVPQNQADLRTMLWGTPQPARDDDFPRDPGHRVFTEDKARFFVDTTTWIDYLRGMDFSFGTRIHGNVAALLAGTPAHVLVHDSRTRELAEYFEIPHTRVDRLTGVPDAAELHAHSDPAPFVGGHAERFDRFCDFLDLHRLDHAHASGADPVDVDTAVAGLVLPEPVRPVSATMGADAVARLSWLYEQHAADHRGRRRTSHGRQPTTPRATPDPGPSATAIGRLFGARRDRRSIR